MNKTYVFKLPITPGHFVNDHKPTLVCNNGAHLRVQYGLTEIKDIYAINFSFTDLRSDDKFISVMLYNGERLWINKKYIVDAKRRFIFKAEIEHNNTNFDDNYREYYFAIPNDDFILTDIFGYDLHVNEQLIKPFASIFSYKHK